MPPVIEVDSADDPRLRDFTGLTDVQLRTKVEQPWGIFIAESERVIRRAARAGYRPKELLTSPKWLHTVQDLATDEAPVYVGSPDLLKEITGFNVHRGALASFHRKPDRDPAEVVDHARRLLVLEDLVSHTNLGAIFRSAAALGMDGVLLSPSCADPLYRRSVRVSMGEVFAVPYARASDWPGDLEALQGKGFQVLALTPDPAARDIATVEQSERVALVLGTEGPGLHAATMAAATTRVRVPMAAGVDSLNVAAAVAVACYVVGRGSPHSRPTASSE